MAANLLVLGYEARKVWLTINWAIFLKAKREKLDIRKVSRKHGAHIMKHPFWKTWTLY